MNNTDVAESFARGESSAKGSNFYHDGQALYSYGSHFIVALRLAGGGFILNADRYSNSTARHQSIARSVLGDDNLLSFRTLEALGAYGMDALRSIKIIDTTESQEREIEYTDPKTQERKIRTDHLLGSTLFCFEGRFFLSSTDASAKSWGQGYFIVELPEPCAAVHDAYNVLAPLDLRESDDYVRQGEFFFRKTGKATKELNGLLQDKNLAAVMGNPEGNRHEAREVRTDGESFFARGTVRHPEHKMLSLGNEWHEVLINRAVNSWGGLGMVD